MKNTLTRIMAVSCWSVAIVIIMSICQAVYADTIYTKDGRQINTEITEITDGTVWYEATSGDITEIIGMDISDIEKITKNDGSTYPLSGSE